MCSVRLELVIATTKTMVLNSPTSDEQITRDTVYPAYPARTIHDLYSIELGGYQSNEAAFHDYFCDFGRNDKEGLSKSVPRRASTSSCSRFTTRELLSSGYNRFDDPRIAGASADLSAEFMTDGGCIRVRQPLEDVACYDQHAWRTETALQSVAFVEVLAQDLHCRPISQTFQGVDRPTVAHDSQHQTCTRNLSVQHDRAGAAGAMLASKVRRGQTAAIAHEVGQRLPRLQIVDDFRPVEFHGDFHACARMFLAARMTVEV
jgi:hypothetical protein